MSRAQFRKDRMATRMANAAASAVAANGGWVVAAGNGKIRKADNLEIHDINVALKVAADRAKSRSVTENKASANGKRGRSIDVSSIINPDRQSYLDSLNKSGPYIEFSNSHSNTRSGSAKRSSSYSSAETTRSPASSASVLPSA